LENPDSIRLPRQLSVRKSNMHKQRVTALDGLSVEIIIKIARYLPPRSAACLSLTSRSLHNGKELEQIWYHGFDPRMNHCGCRSQSQPTCPPLNLVNHEKYLFLQILAGDLLSTHQLCDACQILHLRHEEGNERHICPSGPRGFTVGSIPRVCWEFQVVQRVMNSHRLDIQRGVENPPQPLSRKKDWWVLYSADASRAQPGLSGKRVPQIMKLELEPRIIDDQLIFHTRQRVLLTAAVLDLMKVQLRKPDFTIGKFVVNLMSACSHHGGNSQIIEAVDRSVAELKASYLNDSVGLRFRGTQKCSCCLTEFTLVNFHHPGQGFEILLKTWTNLGPCQWGYQSEWGLASRSDFREGYTGERRARRWAQAAWKLPSDIDWKWVNGENQQATHVLPARNHIHTPPEDTTDLVLFGHSVPSIPEEAIRSSSLAQWEEFRTTPETSAEPPRYNSYEVTDNSTAYKLKDCPPSYQVLTSRANEIHAKRSWIASMFQRLQQKLPRPGKGRDGP
jgi:hypothetical protein